MHASLSLLASGLALASALPSKPLNVRDANPGCQDASTSLEWTVENFDYHASYIFTTPAHQNSWGYVNFTLGNPALLYKQTCSAASNQLSDFFYGTVNYTCTSPVGLGLTTTGEFAFSRPSGKLDLKQRWNCEDQDPQYPVTFTAWGTTNLTLECTDETTTNPNWQIGDIYSDREVKCQPVTVTVKPDQITAIA